jgi:hypothetical protein
MTPPDSVLELVDRCPMPRRCCSARSKRRIDTPKADVLVYELYGLTEAEVAVVEGRG